MAGEGAAAVPGDMVEDGLSLGAEAGHLYTGSISDEVMCPRQRLEGSPPPPAPASQTSRRERPGGGSSATAKRREAFAGRREAEGGGGSFQSDSHSPASHSSIDSLLESRRPDPEEMLFGLGFGVPMGASSVPGPGSVSGSQRVLPSPYPFGNCGNDGGSDDEVSRIPRRFLQPSKVKGVAINDFFKYQQDLIETFESGFCGYRGLTGPSHAVPSVIVAKIMEKLREHDRECSSRGSVTSYGTGPVCHSPTPPPTPPFSPTNNYVGSPLGEDRIQFLQNHPNQHSPIVSPVESQPTTKFSKVARNVMHRSSVLTRMSSTGGDSVLSSDDGPGIACSPTGRATLSVLTPDNRRFLDSQGGKSPEMPRKRMIIGQKSFTFGNDGDLIEDVSQPPTPTSPTLPSKPPLLHKDSVLSSIASLTSCDSDSDTDSAPNVRRSGSSKSGSSHKPPPRSRAGSGGIEIGPWPLGKRVSSTSISSWEEGEGQLSSSYTHGQRTRFLSIDEGDDENLENEKEIKKERWILGDDSVVSQKWVEEDSHGTDEHNGLLMETGSNEGESRLGDKVEGSIRTREDSMNEGLWELELDQPEESEYKNSTPSLPFVSAVSLGVPKAESEKNRRFIPISVEDEVLKQELIVIQRPQNDSGDVEVGKDGICTADDSVPQDTQLSCNLSSSNFSSFSSMQDSCLTPVNIRRGSLKRQTKIEIEEEKVEEMSDVRRTVEVVISALDEISCPRQPAGEPPDEVTQPIQEVPSARAEPPKERQPLLVAVVEEVVKKEMKGSAVKEQEKQKRALSPQGRSGSAHSDSSGFLEWEPPNMRISSTPQTNPLCQNTHSVESSKGREWMSVENNQLPTPDGVATMASSGYYGVEGLSSDMTGQLQPKEAMDIDVRSLKSDLGENSRSESQDGTGKEVALGGGDMSECMSDEGNEEEVLQLAHRELCFVRDMRCCVSEGMERVMQFLGTWSKRRQYRLSSGETDGESAQISSLVSQMTFLLKQQSQLCHEMEQISLQRLLDGQQLGGNFRRDSIPGVKGNSPMLGVNEVQKNDAVIVQRKSEGDLYRPSTSQMSATTSASSKEKHLEGLVEKNARELAELRLLLRAVLLTNQNEK
ncbi:hypothetical protein J437_LFUL001691 [Ladona fulva]|uniref:ITPR-interacting domain-containing protein n=1 Tax=Ladona fulva TaxID=123851 RepID=A0A8K0K2J9_LADFU|nr:hypothetical protein J437_LFUL001691 [Ladona fulva]